MLQIRHSSHTAAMVVATAIQDAIVTSPADNSRFCGRYLATSAGQVLAVQVSVCCKLEILTMTYF